MLYQVIILPIVTIVDWVFEFIVRKMSIVGIFGAICVVSLFINFLALPLYNIADDLQAEERKTVKKLEYRVNRIKKAFKGNEQFMMLSTYYRQNNYHPLYALRSSLSILIEIPFFIAAYQYLSHNTYLEGASFWIFNNLGTPDSLLKIGGLYINVLPIIMTMINLISGYIYSKDAPSREKIQLFVLPLVFLFILYNSPSGLVLYWILNNIFSLVKNVVMKTKNPSKIVYYFITSFLFIISLFFFYTKGISSKTLLIFCLFLGSLIFNFIKLKPKKTISSNNISTSNVGLLLITGLCLSILYGLVIPSSIISTSPEEFSFMGNTPNPLTYVKNSTFIFLGIFLFWPFCLYKLFKQKVKYYLPRLLLVCLICSMFNIFLFKPKYGTLSSVLTISDSNKLNEIPLYFTFISLLIFVLAFVLCTSFKRIKYVNLILLSILIAEISYSSVKITSIKKSFDVYSNNYTIAASGSNSDELNKIYHLSKTGNNVVVLFLDRAISSLFPNIVEQYNDINEALDGFVFYPNTVSFGKHTVYAFPSMAGGYEYTQEEINKRNNELLVDKHNEAMLVMPRLFLDANYEVTVSDPPFSNYAMKGDFTPFERYPQINVSEQIGTTTQRLLSEINFEDSYQLDEITKKQFINFAVLEGMFPFFRQIFYRAVFTEVLVSDNFYDSFSELYYLKDKTDFSNSKDSFIFIDNETCHDPILLKYPDLLLPGIYDQNALGNYNPSSNLEAEDYVTQSAAFKQISKWLNYLRNNDCYDNTRIIIVSDHGYYHKYNIFADFNDPLIPSSHNPLLLFKDFNASGSLITDNTFMTNADTLFLAKKDLNISDFNPFTGKKFIQNKESVNLYPIGYEGEFNAPSLKDKTQFKLKKEEAYSVSNNIFDEKNWIPLLDSELTKEGNK